MGKLFDLKVIDASDLAWAVDRAYNQQVREAARTLLANWIGQGGILERSFRYGPQVIVGSDYLERHSQPFRNFRLPRPQVEKR